MGSSSVNISEALRGIKSIGFDTSPFIYYTENFPNYADKMDVILGLLDRNEAQITTSVITLAEVMVKPLRMGNREVEEKYRKILLQTPVIKLMTITEVVAIRAAQLRAVYNLKTPDALQIATAILSGCDAFLTNDVGIKRVTEIRVLVLDELELDPAP